VSRLDRDVSAVAMLLIARYGADAAAHARWRAKKLLLVGDQAAHDLWIDVARAIEELQRDEDE
jgi:hypothetical protein